MPPWPPIIVPQSLTPRSRLIADMTSPPKKPIAQIASAIFAPRQAIATGERVKLTPEQVTARKRRGQWIALALFAFVILVFVLTMTKLGANVMVRDL